MENNAQTPKFIGLEKLAVGGLSGLTVDWVGRPAICQVKRARLCTSVDRAGRPTCTDVHASSGRRAGRSTRSTVQRALLSEKAPVDRAADRTERLALCILASVDRPVDRWHNGLKYDRWPVDRTVDR